VRNIDGSLGRSFKVFFNRPCPRSGSSIYYVRRHGQILVSLLEFMFRDIRRKSFFNIASIDLAFLFSKNDLIEVLFCKSLENFLLLKGNLACKGKARFDPFFREQFIKEGKEKGKIYRCDIEKGFAPDVSEHELKQGHKNLTITTNIVDGRTASRTRTIKKHLKGSTQ